MVKHIMIVLLALATTSCVTREAAQVNAPKTTGERIGDAVVSPLSDLNVVQTGIPVVLNDAVKNPYLVPADTSCAALVAEITELDKALGPDLDATLGKDKKSDMDQGTEFAQNEAVGSVERTIQGAIPFRSWIRRLSGAEKRSNELKTAVAAGVVRRAFLKGMGQQHGCEPPAAPIVPAPAADETGNNGPAKAE